MKNLAFVVMLGFVVLLGGGIPAVGQDRATQREAAVKAPLTASKTAVDRAAQLRARPWIETIAKEVPPLRNNPGNRMPMIMWHGVGFEVLQPDQIEILKRRGLCQHLQLEELMIPAAKALAEAGVPVILMEGRSDSWPYSLADQLAGPPGDRLPGNRPPGDRPPGDWVPGDWVPGDWLPGDWLPGDWAHQFDLTFVPPWFGKEESSQWHGACPHRTEGWAVLERKTRELMQKFKDAGVRVDAVLVDYEGDPYPWPHLFDQLRHCRRCRKELPAEVIHDRSAWRNYCWKQYVTLYDQHFAKPVRDVFPDCLVTNWHVVYSSDAMPVRYFVSDVTLPELQPKYFSATNPIAYASDAAWRNFWNPNDRLTQATVDDFYRREILHQVRSDRRNRVLSHALDVRSIPWVARVCRIEGDNGEPVPIMSRKNYRRALGQLWKLGIYGMQVFNPMHEGYEELALLELQDAVAAYDQMLERPHNDDTAP